MYRVIICGKDKLYTCRRTERNMAHQGFFQLFAQGGGGGQVCICVQTVRQTRGIWGMLSFIRHNLVKSRTVFTQTLSTIDFVIKLL